MRSRWDKRTGLELALLAKKVQQLKQEQGQQQQQ
jgi:hypothetical protein